jgi:hypothetical protein
MGEGTRGRECLVYSLFDSQVRFGEWLRQVGKVDNGDGVGSARVELLSLEGRGEL